MAGHVWTTEELDRLRQLISEERSRAEIAALFNTTPAAVYWQARKLGLKFSRRQTQRSTWTQAEDNVLIYQGAFMTRKQLAKKLKRTEAAVGKRAMVLGVQLTQGRMTMRELADELGVSKVTIVRLRDKLGLNFRRYPGSKNSLSRPKGPEPEDVAAIATYLVQNSTGPLQTSRKRLMDVIAAYSGELTEEEAA